MFIVFSSSSLLSSQLIKFGTFSRWSHVDALFSDGTLIGADSSARASFKPGVQKLTLEDRLKHFDINYYKIERLELPNEDLARAFIEDQVGKKYDWSGIFAIPFRNRNWQDPESWFCSELVATAAIIGGRPLLHTDTNRMTPGMVEYCPMLTPYRSRTYVI